MTVAGSGQTCRGTPAMLRFSALVITLLVISVYGKEEAAAEKKLSEGGGAVAAPAVATYDTYAFPYTQWKFDSFPTSNLAGWDSDMSMNKRWASQIRFGKRSSWASKVRFG